MCVHRKRQKQGMKHMYDQLLSEIVVCAENVQHQTERGEKTCKQNEM